MNAHMAIDLTGGIDPAREYMFAERPHDPEMRDSVSFWVFDDHGQVGLPRIGVEAVAANWEEHSVQVNVAFPDGRAYRLREDGASWPVEGPDGKPAVLGGGPLAFTCVKPFDVWTMTFDGKAVQTSSADLAAGRKDGPLVDLRFDVEAKLAVPPWVQGALRADAASALNTSVEGDLMGGDRYEQLFRATGSVRVAGEEHAFTGSGLRIRRQGVRKLEGFWGHCWQSALFPSGRAFGYIAYPPRPDGRPTFNEGYLFDGDSQLIPARVVEAPWLTPAAAARRGRLGRAGDRQRHRADRGRDGAVDARHHRPERGARGNACQDGQLDVSRASAGRRALPVERRGDLRHARALQPDGQDRPLADRQ